MPSLVAVADQPPNLLGYILHLFSRSATLQVVAWFTFVFLISYSAISLSTWRRRRSIMREKGTAPPPWFPQKDPFGWDHHKQTTKAVREHRLHEVAAERFAAMGVNTYQFMSLGRHLITTIEPENLKAIQATQSKSWALGTRRKISFRPLLGEGIFTTDGAQWQHSRDMLRPNFVRSQVGDLETFEHHVSNLIAAIQPNKEIDLAELFFRLTIDSATEFLFGESTSSLTQNSSQGFAEAFNQSQDYILHSLRLGKLAVWLPGHKKFQKNAKFVHDFVDYFVDKGLARRSELLAAKNNPEKKAESSQRYVFLDELVLQTPSRVRIRSELLNILLAGRDTTASLLTNVWSVLAQRPDIWAKLQAEVASLDGEAPTFEQLKNLKYLRALLNESLRLHPVVPANSREATEDTVLPLGGGPDGRAPIFIPKGGVVAWNVYTMHRRKDFYGPDAEAFIPERWLDDAETGRKGLRTGWEYLPFNGGARICLGQQFALTEASYTTIRLVQAFGTIGCWKEGPRPWQELLTLTCVNLNGARVVLGDVRERS